MLRHLNIAKKTTLFLTMLLLASVVTAQVTKKADKKFLQGHYSEALQQYNKLLDKNKNSLAEEADIYLKMAKCYMAMRYYNPALKCFEKHHKLNPGYMDNLPMYAEILRCNGRYLDALSCFYRYNSTVDDAPEFRRMRQTLIFPVENNVDNPYVQVSGQYALNTFGKKSGLQFYNNKLYYSTTGYMLAPTASDYEDRTEEYHMFKSDYQDGSLTNSYLVVNEPMFMQTNVVSFAVHPTTSALYYVIADKGKYTLYCSQLKDGAYTKKKEVKMGDHTWPVQYVTFTADGSAMIFSADLKGGYGGRDLWISYLDGEKWMMPNNMGGTINTSADEITPFVFRRTLFFSSDGQMENYGGFDIYSISLDSVIAGANNLKLPYNSCADDFGLVINPEGTGGFLVSTRDTSLLDDRIFGFSQLPDYTLCKGFISDSMGNFLKDVNLTLIEKESGKTAMITKSGENGRYALFLNNTKSYTLDIVKNNFFPLKLEYEANKSVNHLISNNSRQQNIMLDGFSLNTAYLVRNVFHQTADVEVQYTREMASVLKFLKDNPHLNLYIHLFGYMSADEDFNEMLNRKRLQNLKTFLVEHGLTENRVLYESYENVIPTNFPALDNQQDVTYVMYFVMTPKNEKTIFPKTKEIKGNNTPIEE